LDVDELGMRHVFMKIDFIRGVVGVWRLKALIL
jgi:hypothetical protein